VAEWDCVHVFFSCFLEFFADGWNLGLMILEKFLSNILMGSGCAM
jgi:hypothetical protein